MRIDRRRWSSEPGMKTTSIRQMFSKADLARIRDAARDAERRTSGEIVAYLVNRVDDYPEAAWKGATLGALVAAASSGFVYWFGGFWGVPAMLWMTLPAFVGAIGGYLLTKFLPSVERGLIPDASLERRVKVRAESAFLEEEAFDTRDRTGILIFITHFEHRALILADSGIHQKVGEGEWERLVQSLVAGIRAGRTTDALVEVIGKCGELLEQHGVARRSDDQNELADEPRLSER